MKEDFCGKQANGKTLVTRQRSINIFFKKILESAKGFVSKSREFWKNFSFFSILFAFLGWNGIPILSFYAVEIFHKESFNIIKKIYPG